LLHVVPTYLPATRYGGPIVAVHGLCRALVRRGHEVSVFTTNVDGAGVSDVPTETAVMMDGVEVTYSPSRFPRLYWSPAMGRALARRTKEFDLVHSHAIWLWPGIAAGRAAARARVPFVISPRGMLVNELIRRRSRFVKKAWLALLERRNFARASAIHLTSERERDDAAATGVPIAAPFVVPNGIDPPPRPNVPRSNDTIVFLGRINWKKGLDALLVALGNVPDAKLVIAGNDEEELTPKLRDIARACGVEHRVTFRGPIYGEAKDELLAGATLFVLPSKSENFGNVVVEAMAMQTPVIVTPGVGLAADVEAYGAGLVAEQTELARAIRLLLDDPARRAEMGRRGRALVESRFAWDRVAAEMEEAYQCTIRSRR
jgi:glycosyltransferase involved in cell wall biosynthesis